MRKLVAGTRGSRLARRQTDLVLAALRAHFAELQIEERVVITQGDTTADLSTAQLAGKGVFTREIEQQLLGGQIDLAVHSYKDLPTELPAGCEIGAVLERGPSEDVLVAGPGDTLDRLPAGTRVGTGSIRRAAQLFRLRPDLTPVSVRGNVDTRLEKLERGEYDALILAKAGLERLGREDKISAVLPCDLWYPAVGQGALAVEVRADDAEVLPLVRALDHRPTRFATEAERAFLRRLEAGCHAPVGAWSHVESGRLCLAGMVAGPEGEPFITGEAAGPLELAAKVGSDLAETLLTRGAEAILKRLA